MNEQIELSLAFIEEHTAAAAETLVACEPAEVAAFLADIPLRAAVRLVEEFPSWMAAAAIENLALERGSAVLREIPYAHSSVLMRQIAPERRKLLLEALPARLARDIARTLDYPAQTVGAWMDASVQGFPESTRAGECLHAMRAMPGGSGGLVVVTGNRRRFLGVIQLDRLLALPDEQEISASMVTGLKPLSARATLATVRSVESWRRYQALPVVNRRNEVVGLLHRDAIERGLSSASQSALARSSNSIPGHLGTAFVVVLSGFARLFSTRRLNDTPEAG